MREQLGWQLVGRMADILGILTVLVGVVVSILVSAGVDITERPDDTLLGGATIALAIMGFASIFSGVALAHSDEYAFESNQGSRVYYLYAVGIVLVILAVAVGAFWYFRTPPVADDVQRCVA
ncbi:MAG: hypothetical protein J0I49_18600 [Pseudonocardia sp.]|uniref:hypothetical protein n=1 Tax=Pseudonocardia sp. TaxID=60912 RepID=UPI001AC817CA|nr:hypothetical protein [Pseudonocardia sp.]MBN9100100.1 hypothetical protein [Pseudonocardia sp.]